MRGAHLGADAAQLRVDEIAVGGDHGGEVVDPPSLRQQSRELLDERPRARPSRQIFGHRSSLQGLDPGPLEKGPGLAVRFEELLEGLELAARRLTLPQPRRRRCEAPFAYRRAVPSWARMSPSSSGPVRPMASSTMRR